MKNKKFLACAVSLTLAAALTLAACGGPADPTDPSLDPTDPGLDNSDPTDGATGVNLTYFYMDLSHDDGSSNYVFATDNGDGTVYVEYVGAEKKVANMDSGVFTQITEAFVDSGLAELNGQEVYEDGTGSGSFAADYADGSTLAAGFAGTIPQTYHDGYAAMDSFFVRLLADVPVYVGEAMVSGTVNPELLDAMQSILNNSGMVNLDTLVISDIPDDEYFAFTAGLSSRDGIRSAASCAPLMITTAYSLVLVELEEGADAQAVCDDFRNNIDWDKWVCVNPTDALIASSGDMLLCLIGADDMFDLTADAVSAAGWTTLATVENPNL